MNDQKKIVEEIADSLALPITDIDPGSLLQEDLGLNRVEMIDLFTSLSSKFSIFFDRSDTEQVKTVEDLVNLIEDKLLE